MAQCELGLEGFLVEFGDVQEQLDRLVRLLVEQVVEAAEISGRQAADLGVAMAFAAAPADHPAADGGDRQQQEEPEPLADELHAQTSGPVRVGAGAGGAAAARSARARRRRSGNTTLALIARPPIRAPISRATIRAMPSEVGGTKPAPRSMLTIWRLSAPRIAPAARQTRATRRRITRMGEFRKSCTVGCVSRLA